MIKLSVIVPCYNVEKYIKDCVYSIIANNIKDIEIILVNDGSKDKTIEVINELKKEYPKLIKVIDQENKGLSMVRNNGIEKACGEYISFIDGDDTINENMYQEMLDKASKFNYDIVACGVKMKYPDKEINVDVGFDKDCNNITDIIEIMYSIYPSACNKIYKRSLFDKVKFKSNVWYEDVEFIYRLLPLVSSIGKVDGYYYNYYQRESSITYTYNSKLYDLIDNLKGVISYYKDNNFYDEYYEELEYACVRYSYATFIKRLAKMKKREEFKKGVNYVINFINEYFPNYKNNKYLNRGKKGIYLKYFNRFIANIVYIVEKNKAN